MVGIDSYGLGLRELRPVKDIGSQTSPVKLERDLITTCHYLVLVFAHVSIFP